MPNVIVPQPFPALVRSLVAIGTLGNTVNNCAKNADRICCSQRWKIPLNRSVSLIYNRGSTERVYSYIIIIVTIITRLSERSSMMALHSAGLHLYCNNYYDQV